MHGRLLRGCCLALLFLLSTSVQAHYHQKQIDIEEGLSQPTVSTVVPDNHGNIWIGTRFGLNRYRNGHIQRYIDDNRPSSSITGNQIGFLFMDSHEKLWVSTDLGLSLYSESEDIFVRTRTEAVLCAHETSETIYFGGYEGLLLYNKADGTYERQLPREEVPVILSIYPGADGKLLLVQEEDGTWALPGGWVDYDLSVRRNAAKEVLEEAGMVVEPTRLIALLDHNRRHPIKSFHEICSAFVLCEYVSGAFVPNAETVAGGWFLPEALPSLALNKTTPAQIQMCFEASADANWQTVFD